MTLSVFLPRHLSNLFFHCITQDIQHVLRQAWRAMHTARPKRQVHHRVPTRETMVKCIILIRFWKERTWIPPIICSHTSHFHCKTMRNGRNSYMDTLIAQLPAARSCFRLERCCEFRALRAYQNNSEYDIEWCLFFLPRPCFQHTNKKEMAIITWRCLERISTFTDTVQVMKMQFWLRKRNFRRQIAVRLLGWICFSQAYELHEIMYICCMHVASCRHMSKCNVWCILLEYLQEDIENDPWRPSASSVPRADWNGSWDDDGAIGAW